MFCKHITVNWPRLDRLIHVCIELSLLVCRSPAGGRKRKMSHRHNSETVRLMFGVTRRAIIINSTWVCRIEPPTTLNSQSVEWGKNPQCHNMQPKYFGHGVRYAFAVNRQLKGSPRRSIDPCKATITPQNWGHNLSAAKCSLNTRAPQDKALGVNGPPLRRLLFCRLDLILNPKSTPNPRNGVRTTGIILFTSFFLPLNFSLESCRN